MTMKKKILTTLSVVLILGLAALGILAYLQDEDSDVNVMTLGNVSIEQHEYERVVDANGNYEMVNSAKYGEGYKLQDFTQAKPLYPATGAITGWGTKVPFDQLGEGASGAQAVFAGLNNVQDKFVLVENTGKSDAYVRTLIALEYGSNTKDIIGISTGDFWTWNDIGIIQIESNNYYLFEAVYKGSNSRHINGVLPAGEYTYNSLGQVYLANEATNEDVEALDGNNNGTYDILVLSQAVQAEGFDNAQTALDTAFGDITTTNHPWKDGVVFPDYYVSNLDELKAAFAEGGNIQLTDDIEFEKLTSIEPGAEVYLDMNGKTITVDQNTQSNTLIWVKEGAKLVIDGEGTFDLGSVSTMAIFAPYGELVIENGTFIRDEVTEVTKNTTGLFMGCKVTSSNVTINGGYFDPGYYDENAADIEEILAGTKEFTETADDIAKRGNSKDANKLRVAIKDNVSVILNHSGYGTFKVYGGTFVGANPAWGDEGCMLPTTPNYLRPWSYYQGALLDGQTYHAEGLVIPEGYSITKSINADGIPVYTVNYSK